MDGVYVAGAGLDLYGNPYPVDCDDQIQLSPANTFVALDNSGSTGGEKTSGDVLAEGPECFASRIGGI